VIDTHAHLNFPEFGNVLEDVLKRASERGVNKIICASSNLEDSLKSVQIAKGHPGTVFATIGIHPQQTDPDNCLTPHEQINLLKEQVKAKGIVSIGECGLDFSTPPPPEKKRSKNDQIFFFRQQVELSITKKLPIIVHSRKTFEQTIEILNGFPGAKGVFHCYSAGIKSIEKVAKLGFYFGIDGNLTYDTGLQNVVAKIPLEKILLETDSPFLAPVPYRQKQNEPSLLPLIAKKLAEIKGISLEKADKITTENAIRLFSL